MYVIYHCHKLQCQTCVWNFHLFISGLDVTRQDLKGGGSTGASSHDGSSSCSHLSQSDLISQLTEGQFLSTEVGSPETNSIKLYQDCWTLFLKLIYHIILDAAKTVPSSNHVNCIHGHNILPTMQSCSSL